MPNSEYKIVPVYTRSNSRQNMTKESWWDVQVYKSEPSSNIDGCTIDQLLVTIEDCETQEDAIACGEYFLENNLADLERWTGDQSGTCRIHGRSWIKEIRE